jgi:hypothetical protein
MQAREKSPALTKEDKTMLTPETYPIILGHEPIAASSIADTSDAICLRDARGVLITVLFAVNSDSDWTLSVHEGATAAVAAAGTYELASTFPIWVNYDAAASDAMVRQTDAATLVVDTGVYAGKLIVVCFYVSADKLTSGRPWIALGASGGGTGLASVLYQLDGARYQQATPPTEIA